MSRNDSDRIKERIRNLRAKVENDLERLERWQDKDKEGERRKRTRRLILIGGIVTKQAGADEKLRAQLWQWLDDGLSRDFDRALFDLPQRESAPQPESVSQE